MGKKDDTSQGGLLDRILTVELKKLAGILNSIFFLICTRIYFALVLKSNKGFFGDLRSFIGSPQSYTGSIAGIDFYELGFICAATIVLFSILVACVWFCLKIYKEILNADYKHKKKMKKLKSKKNK